MFEDSGETDHEALHHSNRRARSEVPKVKQNEESSRMHRETALPDIASSIDPNRRDQTSSVDDTCGAQFGDESTGVRCRSSPKI